MNKDAFKQIKGLLCELIDTIYLYRQYDNIDLKCKDYDFAQTVINLALEEERYCMNLITVILADILPKEKGLLAFLKRSIVFKKGEHWRDYYSHNLYIRGYNKDCQEFYCLQKIFRDLNIFCSAMSICGYSECLDVFYIDILE